MQKETSRLLVWLSKISQRPHSHRPSRDHQEGGLRNGSDKLKKVKEILEDAEMIKQIMEEHPMKENATVEEYEKTRKIRIKVLVDMAGIDYEEYHGFLQLNVKSVQVVLHHDRS